jgi:hypothetical protein
MKFDEFKIKINRNLDFLIENILFLTIYLLES